MDERSLPVQWTTEKRKIKDLKEFSSNPRQIKKADFEQLKMSLNKFNYVELVAINLDNTIIAGHMRVRALKALKKDSEEIEVRVPSRMLELEEAKEYLIRSNKNTGEWDYDILNNEWDSWDLHAWGFTPADLGVKIENPQKDECDTCSECGRKLRNKK